MIRRDQDQSFTWSGAGFDPAAVITLNIAGRTSAPVTCTALARSGAVTIPVSLLASYSPNSIGTLTATVSNSGASMPATNLQLKNGSTMLVIVSQSSSDSRPVFFQ
jgi:hypothetical protein